MAEYRIHSSEMKAAAPVLRAGDTVYLDGVIYTARDAAHKRILALLAAGEPPPFPLEGATVYYAGPTPARPGRVVGACGPTTASRMDGLTLPLLARGLSCMIGKGERSAAVARGLCEYGAVYLAAIGGAGALIADSIRSLRVLAFADLGTESVKLLEVEGFPAVVAQDAAGGSLYPRKEDGRF